MQRSSLGDCAIVSTGSLELVKWLALAFMLWQHWYTFALEASPPFEVWAVSRAVFPMFALALAFGSIHTDSGALVRRLAVWGVIAGVAGMVVRDPLPANVLFTFALGVTAEALTRSTSRWRWLWIAGVLAAGSVCEFGPGGVAAVAAFCGSARARTAVGAWLGLVIGTLFACYADGNPVAALAVLAVLGLDLVSLEVPRVRRLFYWTYAGQWPVFAVAKVLL